MSASSARPTVTVGGIHELTRRWEPNSEPRADVLIVHGISEHSGRYEHVGEQMSTAGFAVESFDLIGWGASGGARGDIEDWTMLLDQIQGHLEPLLSTPRPTILYGHSMGGLLSAEYLLAERPHPDLAVLSAPALSGGAAWQHAVGRALSGILGKVRVPSRLQGSQLSRDPSVGAAYFSDPLVDTSATVRMGHAFFSAMDRTTAAIDRLAVPTLVIHGTADTIVPPSASEPFERLEVAERRTYSGLRHELHNEPEGSEIITEVIEWISAHI